MKKMNRPVRGFTMIELLMSMVILAMLMAAVGLAFHASTSSFMINQDMYERINNARQVLLRITTDLRTAQGVALLGAGVSQDIDEHRVSLIRANGMDVTYLHNSNGAASYNAALDNNTLYLIVNSGAQAGSYVLCPNVSAMSFVRAVNGSNVRNVQISMTVTNDDGTGSQTLNTAAVVRTAQ
ncbi:MAG: prepilin-type N-terminal cleavage/methylation domain-containing protein [Phycisphaerae bacterium]|nr:prepilin-type N-terminal cleavage/methylation domain-containing protein [Phycisphaerae bacterium]